MDTGQASLRNYDNFLSSDDFNQIKNILLGNNFPWYINKVVSFSNDVQFTHVFYDNDKVNSNAFEILTPILDKINYKKLIRIKTNLLPKTETMLHHEYHIDYPNCTTGIFYVNSNNGITIFKNGMYGKLSSINPFFAESIENRFVRFDSNLVHKGTTCTDENFRCVINFNYEE
jgi:hypothetical protein